jgi:hypothetical protein
LQEEEEKEIMAEIETAKKAEAEIKHAKTAKRAK